MKDIIDLLGRLMLASIFFYLVADKSTDKADTLELMQLYGFTWKPEFLYHATLFALGLGATLIAVGYRAGFGTILICLYWIPYTIAVYNFWEADPTHRNFELVMFSKNLAILGGLLILSAHGAGKYSIKRLLATTRVGQF